MDSPVPAAVAAANLGLGVAELVATDARPRHGRPSGDRHPEMAQSKCNVGVGP